MRKIEMKSSKEAKGTLGPEIILVIEDDEGLNRLIQKNLKREEFHTEGPLTGKDAIARILKDPNVILLLDYKLPDMTGKQVIEKLAKKGIEVPFILMTGYGDEKIAVEMMKLGAREYLVKDAGFVDVLPLIVKKVFKELDKEKKLVMAQEALRVSVERYRELSDSITDIFFAMNKYLKYTYWNKASEKLTGFSANDAIGKSILEVFPDNEETKSAINVYQKVLKTQQSHTFINEYHFGDEKYFFEINAYPSGDGLSVLVKDITERRKNEEEREEFIKKLEALNKELIRASKLKDDILANTSHELRTPLNSIIGLLKLIMDGLYDNEMEKEEFIKIAYDNSQHLLAIINDLLDLARIESGKISLEPGKMDVSELFKDIKQLFQKEVEGKGLEFIVNHPSEKHGRIVCDRLRLKQVISNLVNNSIKFTSSGYIELSAVLEKKKKQMLFIVKDTGIGIVQKDQEELFKPFVQQDRGSKRKYGGTGLGLAISKDLVDLMGGTIKLESKGKGKGTKVSFTIPIKAK
jgi:PAS domain S-box-containing protein